MLNVLGGDKVAPVSRQLLKPFKPGEARFGDLETSEASNGAKILKDAVQPSMSCLFDYFFMILIYLVLRFKDCLFGMQSSNQNGNRRSLGALCHCN